MTHPVIDLLVARMKSHPQEFTEKPYRWQTFIEDARIHTTKGDHDTLQEALSLVMMDKLHEQVMDELLNGEERRAALAEEEKQARQMKQAVAAAQQQAAQQAAQSLYPNPVTSALNQANSYGFYNDLADSVPVSGISSVSNTVLTEQGLINAIKNLAIGKGAK